MGIIEYIPTERSIIDRRKPDGGYYIAKCNICEREYYPLKSNAKYCCQTCSQKAYRIRILAGKVSHRKERPKLACDCCGKEFYVADMILKEEYYYCSICYSQLCLADPSLFISD